jgi:hypothetical protein
MSTANEELLLSMFARYLFSLFVLGYPSQEGWILESIYLHESIFFPNMLLIDIWTKLRGTKMVLCSVSLFRR